MAAYKPYDRRHRDLQEDVKPPNSRLFVICGKGIKEETFKETFEKFGEVEDIWVVKDKRTNEDKGVAYIKYAKASEAALAIEEMNGRCLSGHPKPIKVLIASSKREGSIRDPKEDEKLLRLFVICPKTFSKDDLRKEFEKYGDIDSVTLVTDRYTGEAKGFGYVRFHRAYHAALALETCDSSFKPKFADPKPLRDRDRERDNFDSGREMFGGYGGGYRDRHDRDYERSRDRHSLKRGHSEMLNMGMGVGMGGHDDFSMGSGGGGGGGGHSGGGYFPDPPGPPMPVNNMNMPSMSSNVGPMEMLQTYQSQGSTRLHITAPIGLTQGYLTRLFSLIPGLEYCDLNETTGIAYARYTTPQCASYARDKLDGFEYPIGSRLIVRFADGPSAPPDVNMGGGGYDNYRGYLAQGNREDNTLQKAALVLEKAGINPDRVLSASASTERVGYCSIPLPFPKPMKPEDTEVCQRLFIVCQPSGIPEKVLRDAFCRFGNLIDVYLLPARNYGYAKFATKDSAMKAIQILHGQNLAGNRLKVLEAEPPKDHPDHGSDDESMKRPRY